METLFLIKHKVAYLLINILIKSLLCLSALFVHALQNIPYGTEQARKSVVMAAAVKFIPRKGL